MLQDSARLTRSERSAKISRVSIGFRRWNWAVLGIVLALVAVSKGPDLTVLAQSSCGQSVNPIECENQKPGDPSSQWDIGDAGDPSIQGFATEISVAPGQVERFKIDTNASSYAIDIYRMGYYGGMGARKVASITPSASLPQSQPACLTSPSTGLIDCGNWAVSASWTVPSGSTSGIYFAKLQRTDTGGESHIVFVVRDDTGTSDLVFQTSDTTWQAYNQYGGNSLYVGGPGTSPGRAYKVSYNRPITTRSTSSEDFVFNAEYPMVRWLEANGFNVSYISGVDTDRSGATVLSPSKHKVFLSVGHDEYWSGGQRANVEAARGAGLHLAFFSGNEVFWKTRWETSIDGTNTPYRTLVCYKETHANGRIDPNDPPTWTGTWRDPRFSPPSDGGRPENALTGTIFKVNAGTSGISVPAQLGKARFWRNTSVATLAVGGVANMPNGTLGYEWDEEANNGARPPGLIHLSQKTVSGVDALQDFGSTYASGTVTHSLTLYRHPSGALVFGAGSVQWSWGLDASHDRGNAAADVRMQQATVNLFADMGVQPRTLQAGLVTATASSDVFAPQSTITSPTSGSSFGAGSQIAIAGTATDTGGGIVAGVEVSTDGGLTWSQATGTTSWTYNWTVSGSGTISIQSRAFDDSGNMETPTTGVTISVTARSCPCSIWGASVPPSPLDSGDTASVELGTKFRAETDGFITGVRFYKASTNTGTHTGSLWTRTGTLLGSATFANETASGWQQATFASPIAITAGTTYVVSYHAPNGHYTGTDGVFANGVDTPPLHGLKDGLDGFNGLYLYGSAVAFPTNTYNSDSYWVDVVFTNTVGADTTPPTIVSTTPASAATGVNPNGTISIAFSEAIDPSTVSSSTIQLRDATSALVTATLTYDAASRTATMTPGSALAASSTYTASVKGGATDPRVKDLAGNALTATYNWSFTTASQTTGPNCPCSIWSSSTVPTVPDDGDPAAVEIGTKFRSDVAGSISGARFYKSTANTGTHVAHLWTSTGTLLATATFSNESASGWQQVSFPSPVPISANTTYVISYFAPRGHYAGPDNYFQTAGVDNAPLHALRDGVDGPNGVYAYTSSGAFPTQTYLSESYFVDVVLTTATGPTFNLSGTITPAANASGATVTLTGGTTATTAVDSNGSFTFTGLQNGAYTVTPSKTGFTFTPTNQAVTINGANGTATFTVQAATYSISGAITPASSGSGATVLLSGSATATATADASGNYTFSGLANGSYTVTPSKSGFTFTPVNRAVTISNANVTASFTAQAVTYAISGSITPATSGSGATIVLSGAGTGATTADANGNFTFNGLANGSYTLTPSKSGFTFTPVNQAVTINGANGTATFAAQAAPTFAISGTIAPASSGSGAIVVLSGGASGSTSADASGNYTFSGLANGSYTVTPSKSGFSFTPASQTVVLSGSNGTANFAAQSLPTFSISGTITPAALGTGVTLNLTGGATMTTTTDANGNYAFAGLFNGQYTVTPSKSGVSFAPASQVVTITAANATANFTASTGIAIDALVSVGRSNASTSLVSPAFSTTAANELFLAFIGSDRKSGTASVSNVTGASLTWQLVRRTNAQFGTAEIWRAFSPTTKTNVTVTATLSQSVAAALTVVTVSGVDTTGASGSGAIGATASGSANSGAPTATLVTTRANSLVFGVGNDWDNAVGRTLGPNQTPVSQYLATTGDTFWVQRTTAAVPASGTSVTINDTAPGTDRYNLTICEIRTP